MAAGIALVAWSGWQNLRQRRTLLQVQQDRRVDLIPDTQTRSRRRLRRRIKVERQARASLYAARS
jgi:hypothetical protein